MIYKNSFTVAISGEVTVPDDILYQLNHLNHEFYRNEKTGSILVIMNDYNSHLIEPIKSFLHTLDHELFLFLRIGDNLTDDEVFGSLEDFDATISRNFDYDTYDCESKRNRSHGVIDKGNINIKKNLNIKLDNRTFFDMIESLKK